MLNASTLITVMKECGMRAPAMAMTALSRLSAAVCCRYTPDTSVYSQCSINHQQISVSN